MAVLPSSTKDYESYQFRGTKIVWNYESFKKQFRRRLSTNLCLLMTQSASRRQGKEICFLYGMKLVLYGIN